MKKSYIHKCPTCGINYYSHFATVRDCLPCIHSRDVARRRAMAAHPAGKGRVSDPSAKV